MTILGLSAQVVIAGTDYSSHLVSSERNATLEQPGATVTLQMDAAFPHASVNPWDDLLWYENGVKVLTGYVMHITPSRAPAKVEIQGVDTFRRCLDYFVDDNLYTGGPDAELSLDLTTRNVGYYTTYLCNLCGISFNINDGGGSAINLKSDIPLGLRNVSDALIVMCQVAQWNMRVDPNGVLQFYHLANPSTPDYTLSNVDTFQQDRNDTDSKNLVKIWGFQDILTSGSIGGGATILYQEARAVPGINDTRTMVFAIPQVDTLAKAKEVARISLDQWARLDNVGSFESPGDPNILVGQSAQFFHAALTGGSYFDIVSDLKAEVTAAGYKQNLTLGRRAYRYPYWPMPGHPPAEWDATTVYGDALDCTIYGDSVYVVGWCKRNNDPLTPATLWRIERRLLVDGSLVWGRSVDNTQINTATQSTANIQINGVSVSNGIVFVTGNVGLDGAVTRSNWCVQAYDSSSGNILWTDTIVNGGANTFGYDVIANSSQVVSLGSNVSPMLQAYATSGGGSRSFNVFPQTKDQDPDNPVTYLISTNMAALRQIYQDSDGSFLSVGAYQFPYHKIATFFSVIYFYAAEPWFGKFNPGGNTIWEVKRPYGGGQTGDGVSAGQGLTVAIDLNLNLHYRNGPQGGVGQIYGGLAEYNQTAFQWQNPESMDDPNGHVEIGEYVFATNGVSIKWYDPNDGSAISSRTGAGVSKLHGIQLYAPTSQMVVCGQKNGLFWTAMWDQPL